MLYKKLVFILFGAVIIISLTNCCASKNEIENGKEKVLKTNAPIPLSPGTAEINCTIEDLFHRDNKELCSVRVISVERYGSSISPIGAGIVINMEFNENDKTKLEKLREEGTHTKLTVMQLRGGMGQEFKNSMKIIKINN
jgi:hypothetical protein